MGGRFLAQRISVRTGALVFNGSQCHHDSLSRSHSHTHSLPSCRAVTIIGGFVFLMFAISGLVMDDEENFLTQRLQEMFAPSNAGVLVADEAANVDV